MSSLYEYLKRDDINKITLTTKNGLKINFDIIAIFPMEYLEKEKIYVILMPEDDSEHYIPFFIDNNGKNEFLHDVDDENEIAKVDEVYAKIIQQQKN